MLIRNASCCRVLETVLFDGHNKLQNLIPFPKRNYCKFTQKQNLNLHSQMIPEAGYSTRDTFSTSFCLSISLRQVGVG